MTIEIRPCRTDEEYAGLKLLIGNAFATTRETTEREFEGFDREWTLCAFEDGRPISSTASIPVTAYLNGAPVKAGGVTAVSTAPSHRRRGLVRQLIAQMLLDAHERGEAISLLSASRGAIYQRFGYGLASNDVRYEFDPREVAFTFDEPIPGSTWSGLATEAIPRMRPVHDAYVARGNLGVDRLDAWWPMRTAHDDGPDHDVYAGIYSNTAGEPRGYFIYTLKDEAFDDAQDMTITEFVALDVEAFRGLWELIRRHDLVRRVRTEWLAIPDDDPAPLLLLEPRALHRREQDGIWMRVVDARATLAARPYSADGNLTLRVEGDVLCPWNNGVYRLTVADAKGTVERGEGDTDLTLTPNALGTLIAGHSTASALTRAGMIRTNSAAAARLADAMFATEYAPHSIEGF